MINKTTEEISRASVNVCSQSTELKAIPIGQRASGSFTVTCEGHYNIEVELQSGRVIRTEKGYVTGGFNFRDEILVTDTGIEFKGNAESHYQSRQGRGSD